MTTSTSTSTSTSTLPADSIIDILVAQCRDLESLLTLARQETVAAQQQDFEKILEVTAGRATLGERLEVYHRQLAELRNRLGEQAYNINESPVFARTLQLIAEIRVQDTYTRPLLLNTRAETLKECLRVDQARRSLNAYTANAPPTSIACDRHI